MTARRPAFAKELRTTLGAGITPNVRAHTGPGCWERASQSHPGHRLVVPIDDKHGAEDYDFSDLEGLDALLVATGDIVLARQVAIAMCAYRARLVVLLHPQLLGEFFYAA